MILSTHLRYASWMLIEPSQLVVLIWLFTFDEKYLRISEVVETRQEQIIFALSAFIITLRISSMNPKYYTHSLVPVNTTQALPLASPALSSTSVLIPATYPSRRASADRLLEDAIDELYCAPQDLFHIYSQLGKRDGPFHRDRKLLKKVRQKYLEIKELRHSTGAIQAVDSIDNNQSTVIESQSVETVISTPASSEVGDAENNLPPSNNPSASKSSSSSSTKRTRSRTDVTVKTTSEQVCVKETTSQPKSSDPSADLEQCQQRLVEDIEEKIHLSTQACDMVYGFIAKLDAALVDLNGVYSSNNNDSSSSSNLRGSNKRPRYTSDSEFESEYEEAVSSVVVPTVEQKPVVASIPPPATKYCVCQLPLRDNMIACDNENCKREWFHYSCVGMREVPTGLWYCTECLLKSRRQAIEKLGGSQSMDDANNTSNNNNNNTDSGNEVSVQ